MEIFNLDIAVANFGPLLAGLLMTVELTLVVIVLSLVFALFVALGGLSRFAPLRSIKFATSCSERQMKLGSV